MLSHGLRSLEKIYIAGLEREKTNVTLGGVGDDVGIVPFYDSLTSSCAHIMGIRCQHWIRHRSHVQTRYDNSDPHNYQVVRPYSLYEKNGLTPVDPAGPDCYQSGTKPCELTQQCVAYGSVTRSQHAQGTWITSGN